MTQKEPNVFEKNIRNVFVERTHFKIPSFQNEKREYIEFFSHSILIHTLRGNRRAKKKRNEFHALIFLIGGMAMGLSALFSIKDYYSRIEENYQRTKGYLNFPHWRYSDGIERPDNAQHHDLELFDSDNAIHNAELRLRSALVDQFELSREKLQKIKRRT